MAEAGSSGAELKGMDFREEIDDLLGRGSQPCYTHQKGLSSVWIRYVPNCRDTVKNWKKSRESFLSLEYLPPCDPKVPCA